MTAAPIVLLDPERLARVRMPYATRRVPRTAMATLITDARPGAGDLVLARIDKLGQHRHLELASGRRARLFQGDEVVLAYGNRYAPDQFEAELPGDLAACHMVAAGGVASRVLTRHAKMSTPTCITPIGLVGDRTGRVINMAAHALDRIGYSLRRPFTIAVVGTSMNAGKTETATNLVRGLRNAGLSVGAAKVTGTGAGPDTWSMLDAGAEPVLDFTDCGLVSTYLATKERVEETFVTLNRHLARAGVDAIVLEVADGIFQGETAALVQSRVFREHVDAIVFAAGDALGATAGATWLRGRDLPVVATAGVLTSSPLAAREARIATDLPILTLDELSSAAVADKLGVTAAVRRASRAAV